MLEDGDGGDGPMSADASKQIKDLKSLLLQRDNEIAILVSMVKKGKTMEDVRSSSGATSRSGGGGGGGGEYDDDERSENRSGPRRNESTAKDQHAQALARQQQQQQQLDHHQRMLLDQQQRDAAREEKILKRHLFGVPPPPDQSTFDDAAASFEWFRERCSLNASMEENRELLKTKITEAKTLGERVNQSRATISYLKNSIEAIRREQALRRIDTDEGGGRWGGEGRRDAHAGEPGGADVPTCDRAGEGSVQGGVRASAGAQA